MVVQHFSPVGFSRNKWPAQAQKIIDNLNLSSIKLSELEYPNPPIELGEVYIGYKRGKNQLKLIYILPKPIVDGIGDGEDKIWATFVRIYPPKSPPNPFNSWRVSGAPTKMSLNNPTFRATLSGMTEKIEKSYPQYISLTQLKELLKPIQFMNWMWERPISPKEEPKITKEEPKESGGYYEWPEWGDKPNFWNK